MDDERRRYFPNQPPNQPSEQPPGQSEQLGPGGYPPPGAEGGPPGAEGGPPVGPPPGGNPTTPQGPPPQMWPPPPTGPAFPEPGQPAQPPTRSDRPATSRLGWFGGLWRRRVAAIGVALAIALGSGTAGAAAALMFTDSPRPSSPVVAGSDSTSGQLAKVADAVSPSVVSVAVQSARGKSQGSGVILRSNGTILTNNHVVAPAAGGAGAIAVTFADGRQAKASIVGRDPATDLAVIKARDVSGRTPATLGDSSELDVGEKVLAIGSPLGLEGSVTAGIVSALNRTITLGGGRQAPPAPQGPFPGQSSSARTTAAVVNAIQTDAPINPGNSGGPLVDAHGRVVGITSAIATMGGQGKSGNIGIGFAIPINQAEKVAQQLIKTGKARHARLGVSVSDVRKQGALVRGVVKKSPAAEAGLRQGDLITKFDGHTITGAEDLVAAVRSHQAGDKVKISYQRDGEQKQATVTLTGK